MIATIEQLQRIVADETRSTEDRRAAAEHILALQANTTGEPAPAANDDLDQILRVFAQMRLSPEQIEEDEDERVERENAVRKACPKCFRCQPLGNEVCDLCGHEPDRWLPSEERLPRRNRIGDIIDDNGNVIVRSGRASGAHVEAHAGRQWRRWASTHATVNELAHVVSRFTAPDADWQVKHAAIVLKLRGQPIPLTFWGQVLEGHPSTVAPAMPQQSTLDSIDLKKVKSYYDYRLAQLQVEQGKLDEQEHQASATTASAL